MKNGRSLLYTMTSIVILLLGIGLIFYNQIQSFLVSHSSEQLAIENYTVEEIQINLEQEVSFEFEEVQSLSIRDVLMAQANIDDLPVIGSIVIPNVDLQLPILKGVSNYAISVGAGTMKPDQVMGTGNYALASHYIENKDILFAPLYNTELGDEIYITDLDKIYKYVITKVEVIEATAVHVIDDVPAERLLTLITCAEKGTRRLFVQANFVDSFTYDEEVF